MMLYGLYGIIAVLVAVFDRLSKYLITSGASVGDTVFDAGKLFDFTYVRNDGAAWSMLSGKVSLLSVVSAIFCVVVVIYMIRQRPVHPLLGSALSLMLGGAFSNMLDRIFYGYVVDFINLGFINFPVFNIADIGITCGAAMVILYALIFDRSGKNTDMDKN